MWPTVLNDDGFNTPPLLPNLRLLRTCPNDETSYSPS
jgi:hypothetical protein